MRSPVIRPDDFVRPSPEPASPPFVPPENTTDTRQYERPAPPPPLPKQPVVDAPSNAASAPAAPLLDLRSSIAAIWSRRLIVLGLALLGAVAGGAVAPRIAQKFTAVSSLYFDPRQIGLADTGAQSSGPSPEMISALIDSQVQILTSGNVLRRVAEAMKLDQDPEFTGGRTDGAAVIGTLQKALVITREASTYVVSLAATTNDPEKSARLANQVVTSFTEEENSASNGIYENTSSTLDGRLNDLRQKVLEAEQAVETFRADNDMAATEGNLISDQRLVSLNTMLVTAQEKTIQAKARADAVANLRVEDIVAKATRRRAASPRRSSVCVSNMPPRPPPSAASKARWARVIRACRRPAPRCRAYQAKSRANCSVSPPRQGANTSRPRPPRTASPRNLPCRRRCRRVPPTSRWN